MPTIIPKPKPNNKTSIAPEIIDSIIPDPPHPIKPDSHLKKILQKIVPMIKKRSINGRMKKDKIIRTMPIAIPINPDFNQFLIFLIRINDPINIFL